MTHCYILCNIWPCVAQFLSHKDTVRHCLHPLWCLTVTLPLPKMTLCCFLCYNWLCMSRFFVQKSHFVAFFVVIDCVCHTSSSRNDTLLHLLIVVFDSAFHTFSSWNDTLLLPLYSVVYIPGRETATRLWGKLAQQATPETLGAWYLNGKALVSNYT